VFSSADGNLRVCFRDEKTNIKGALGYPQEKATSNEPAEVLNERRTRRDDGPDQHPGTHVPGRPDFGDQHVGGDLHQHVADEQDADAGVEIGAVCLLVAWMVR
jgi:hypothetical protein